MSGVEGALPLPTRPAPDFAAMHAAIAARDPLRALPSLRQVPESNVRQDFPGLLRLLQGLLPTLDVVRGWDAFDAAAGMRDLGFLIGSIRRHGHEPAEVLPALEPVMLELSRLTGLPPSVNLLHVTVWNPADPALERRFTKVDAEAHLFESVRLSMAALEAAVHRTLELYEEPLTSPAFAPMADDVAHLLRKMVDAIVYAYRNIPPQIFAAELRPYFEPVRFAGKSWLGPGAVEMPLFVLEHALWSSSTTHRGCTEFKETYVPYILPQLRPLYHRFTGRPSLLDRAEAEARDRGPTAKVLASLKALDRIFEVILRFRAPHMRLAEQAYVPENEAHSVGSGGYAPAMLGELLALTRDARARLTLFDL
ncbi:monodechloroaminopyrrolnitrin synthase PrnB family protein [Pendulispora albinea]|uniref:DUF1864 family protein n=1 Tax=Pendulispora albinea TaxID=2741071 RepID=A0ABZ2MAR9_9BACT